jgi:hypothetical protein
MNVLLIVPAILVGATPIRFERHEIDAFPAGYQVAVADLNGDARPDVIALSTDANRVDWYENPTWKRRPVARVERPIDLAVHDLDGDGKPEIALASGFYFGDSGRGGQIQWLKPRTLTPGPSPAGGPSPWPSPRGSGTLALTPGPSPRGRGELLLDGRFDEPWEIHPIAVDPVTHRLRWADLDGDGKKVLVHAPIFGPGSKANIDPKPSHLWAFRVPKDPLKDPWPVVKIDETLTVLHGLCVVKASGDRRDQLLTASYEGIFRVYPEGSGSTLHFRRQHISSGEKPVDQKPGAARGSSEVAYGRLGLEQPLVAAIEPWHGNEVVVYTPTKGIGGGWDRRVLDDTLAEGHALVVADFDGDGQDEIVAGWRAGGGGLNVYKWTGGKSDSFRKIPLDRGIAVEGAVAADINADGRLDLVVIAGRTNNLAWYENKGRGKG